MPLRQAGKDFRYLLHGLVEASDRFGAVELVEPCGCENVASYAIGQGTLSLGANYALSYAGSNFGITPRAVTVTAMAGQGKVHGEAEPALAYAVTAGNTVSGDSFSGSLSRAAGENVGSYAIGRGTLSLGANYALSYVGSNFGITPRPEAKSPTANPSPSMPFLPLPVVPTSTSDIWAVIGHQPVWQVDSEGSSIGPATGYVGAAPREGFSVCNPGGGCGGAEQWRAGAALRLRRCLQPVMGPAGVGIDSSRPPHWLPAFTAGFDTSG